MAPLNEEMQKLSKSVWGRISALDPFNPPLDVSRATWIGAIEADTLVEAIRIFAQMPLFEYPPSMDEQDWIYLVSDARMVATHLPECADIVNWIGELGNVES